MAAGIVVCTTAAAVVLPSLSQRPLVQRHVLPDHQVITMESVTYGKQHLFERNFGGLGGFLGKRSERIDTESDSMVFWVSITPSSPHKSPDLWSPVVFDEYGREILQGRFTPSYSRASTSFLWFEISDIRLGSFVVEAFPRRGNIVGIRFYAQGGKGPIAEFTAPNPTPGPHPVWTAEPYPITKRVGDIDFTLTSLATGLRRDGQPALPGQAASTRLRFRISENGKPTRDWEPARVVLSDATGNRVVNEISRSDRGPVYNDKGEIEIWLDKSLCADESAWKLDTEFSRTAAARFSHEESWSVKAIPAPRENQLIPLSQSDSRQGATIRLVGIAGPGSIEWSPGKYFSGSLAEIRARVSLPCDGLRLTLTAQDDRGRAVAVSNNGYKDLPDDSEREYSFHLQVPSDASALDLRFALHKSRFAEFLARPSKP